MSLNDTFGEAKFGGGTRTNWFKFPKDGGTLTLRILPPIGSLKKSGKWAQYYSVHFGYRDSKGKLRPFQSCQVKNNATKMIEVSDPAVERINGLKGAQEKAKLEGNTALVSKIGEQLKIFNVSSQFYMNVIDLSGKVGVISIPYRMKTMLDDEIKRLQSKGVNPLSVSDGRFFSFTRTGSGPSTVHKVSVYQEEVEMNGQKVQIEKKSVLTADVADRALSDGADLGSLYISPTPEDIKAIVTGDARTLEAVFAKYRTSKNDDSGGALGEDEDDHSSPSVSSTQQSAAASLGQATTATAAMSVATPVTVPTPAAPAQDLNGMSNEEFLKSLGV